MLLDADWPDPEASPTVDGELSAVDVMAADFGTAPFRGRPQTDWRDEPRVEAGGADGLHRMSQAAGLGLIRLPDPFPETQSRLATMIVVSIPLTVAFAWATFLSAVLMGRNTSEIKEFTVAMIGAIAGLSGAILGYYYGRVQLGDRSNRRSRRRDGS